MSGAELDEILKRVPWRAVEDVYELTAVQKGLLYETLLAPESGVYVIQLAPLMRGKLDERALKRAWQEVVKRYAVYRTAFSVGGVEKPEQVVLREVKLVWRKEDWSGMEKREQEEKLATYLEADRKRGFAFNEAPLMRMALFQTGAEEHRLRGTQHHLLTDGWSLARVMKDVLRLYEGYAAGQG